MFDLNGQVKSWKNFSIEEQRLRRSKWPLSGWVLGTRKEYIKVEQ